MITPVPVHCFSITYNIPTEWLEKGLHRIEQSGVFLLEKEQPSMKKRESVKPEESTKNAKQEPSYHHQSRYSLACSICNRQFRVKMSLVMRKPDFCICENKDADLLCGYRTADQRLCFRYSDSTIPLLPKSKISSL